MREFFLRKIGVRKIPFRFFLIVFIGCFIIVKYADSQVDTSKVPKDSAALASEIDTSKVQQNAVADTTAMDTSKSGGTIQVSESGGEHSTDSVEHVGSDINRGKRFFLGILPFGRKYEACASCHYINEIDTFNWNPAAMDIARKYQNMDFASFKQVLMAPSSKKLMEVHKDFTLEDADIHAIKSYLTDMAEKGYPKHKLNIMWLVGFIVLILIVVWSLAELIIIKMIRFRLITVIILLGSLTWLTKILYQESTQLGRQQNYAPLQPIKFSHQVHAGINQTDCLYCHSTAEFSKSAGIPSANVCMNCHLIVREGTNSGKFEINKIHDAYDNNKPIQWVRVHNLPDHVFFSHAQHIGAGKLDCAECHGPVKEMNLMEQYSPLSMGWCLDCHRSHKVQFVENDYYRTYKEYHDQITSGKIDSVTVEQIGGTDCMKCHY